MLAILDFCTITHAARQIRLHGLGKSSLDSQQSSWSRSNTVKESDVSRLGTRGLGERECIGMHQ